MSLADLAGASLSSTAAHQEQMHAIVRNGISHEDAIAALSAVVDRLKSLRVPLNSSAFSLALTREEAERLA